MQIIMINLKGKTPLLYAFTITGKEAQLTPYHVTYIHIYMLRTTLHVEIMTAAGVAFSYSLVLDKASSFGLYSIISLPGFFLYGLNDPYIWFSC